MKNQNSNFFNYNHNYSIFSGSFYILQNITNSKDSGILSNIETVENLQVNLGFIDKNLGEIKEDTTTIKEDTKIIKEVTNFILNKLKISKRRKS